LEKTLINFDKSNISLELMLFLENKGIKYLFESNERYYQNKILTMKSRDETVQEKSIPTELKTTAQVEKLATTTTLKKHRKCYPEKHG